MNHLIETSKDKLTNVSHKELEHVVSEHAQKLERVLKNYRKASDLEVYVKAEGSDTYKVRYLIDLFSKPIIAKAASSNLLEAAAEAYEKMRASINKQLAIERKEHIRHKQEMQFEKLTSISGSLAELKENEEREMFESLISKSLPALKGYIRRKTRQAKKHLNMRIRAQRAQDILDELYTRLYDSYKLHMTSRDDFYTWVYREADRLLAEKLAGNGEPESYESIEQMRKQERKGIEENYTVDADGDYTMMEELDDPTYRYFESSYEENPYAVQILTDNDEEEQRILQMLDEEISEEELNEKIHRALAKLPKIQQEVYDLFYLEDLNARQIAEIKEMKEDEVVSIVNQVRDYLKERFVENQKS